MAYFWVGVYVCMGASANAEHYKHAHANIDETKWRHTVLHSIVNINGCIDVNA